MKKVEQLGRKLSKGEQKKIKGGNPPIECDEGVPYCCDWETTSGSMNQDNVCASSIMDAKATIIQTNSNVFNVRCELA